MAFERRSPRFHFGLAPAEYEAALPGRAPRAVSAPHPGGAGCWPEGTDQREGLLPGWVAAISTSAVKRNG